MIRILSMGLKALPKGAEIIIPVLCVRKESRDDEETGKGQLEEYNNGQNKNRAKDQPHTLSRRLFFLSLCFLMRFSPKD